MSSFKRSRSPSPGYSKRDRVRERAGEKERGERQRDRHRDGGRQRERDRDYHHRFRRSPSEDRQGYRRERRREQSLSPERPAKRHRSEEGGYSHKLVYDLPEVGSIVQGAVVNIKPFGVFVSLNGHQKHVLVHHSQVSEDISFTPDDDDADKVAALEYFTPVGAKVTVKVTELQDDGRGSVRLSCSIKAVDQETGKDLDPENKLTSRGRRGGGPGRQEHLREGAPELNSIHKAEVASIKPFGVFVRLEGYRTNGLVHVSQVSDHMDIDREDSDEAKIAAIGQVLTIGESIWVKVVEIKDADPGSDRGPKVGCSLKLVSQKDGTDLDPHGLKFKPKPADGEFGQRKQVGADAGQVVQGQIDWGHLNAEKVNLDPSSAGYEMLGAEVEDIGSPHPHLEHDGLPLPPKKGLKKQQKLQQSHGITSVEEALAILKAAKSKSKKKKEKKEKKSKKSKKPKKKQESSSDS